MALFSSKVLQSARLSLLSLISWKLLTNPKDVIEYTGVVVLASSMNLPILMVNDKSPIYGSIAVLLLGLIVSDIGPLLENNTTYFEATIPIRLIFYLSLCVYCYCGEYIYLCNSVVFCYGFLEVWFNILLYSTIKEEKYKRLEGELKIKQEMNEKYERGELKAEEAADFEKNIEEQEYKKIMEEFQN